MAATLNGALYEGVLLFQAFIAAIGSISAINPFNRGWHSSAILFGVAPFLFTAAFFTVLVQLKLSTPSRRQILLFELIKSGLVTALFVWVIVDIAIGHFHYIIPKHVFSILSLVVIAAAFYSTLILTFRREQGSGRGLGGSLRDEAEALLPH